MDDFRTLLGIAVAATMAWLFWRYIDKRKRAAAALPWQLFAQVLPLLANPRLKPGEAIGTWQVTGEFEGKLLQLKAVTDTLAVRKLPSLWLMVTLAEAQPVGAIFDLMMRPHGPTTFSNFDFLAHTVPTPPGFPEEAVIRTDSPGARYPEDALRREMGAFVRFRGKELLVSPKGLRVVLQAGEADRARYGVFREASFGDTTISGEHARKAMEMVLALAERLQAR